MYNKITLSFLLLFANVYLLYADNHETAIWHYLSIVKPIDNRWTISAQTELRSGDDNTRLYLWYLDGSARYKFNSWLTGSFGFDYIKVHSRANAKRGAVWLTDWRPYVGLTPSWKMGMMRTSLSELLTYNWFPETKKDNTTIHGNSYYLARHRLTLEYLIQKSRVTPFAKFELRHTRKLERFRTTIGITIKLNEHHSLEVGHIYQDMHNSTKTNALDIGYRIKL